MLYRAWRWDRFRQRFFSHKRFLSFQRWQDHPYLNCSDNPEKASVSATFSCDTARIDLSYVDYITGAVWAKANRAEPDGLSNAVRLSYDLRNRAAFFFSYLQSARLFALAEAPQCVAGCLRCAALGFGWANFVYKWRKIICTLFYHDDKGFFTIINACARDEKGLRSWWQSRWAECGGRKRRSDYSEFTPTAFSSGAVQRRRGEVVDAADNGLFWSGTPLEEGLAF